MFRVFSRPILVTAIAAAATALGSFAFAQPATPPQPAAEPPLTLESALARARLNSQVLVAADTAARIAEEDRVQARAGLLPSLSGFAQYIYTQPNGTPSGVFVANDGPKVYSTWGTVHGDLFSAGKWADYRSANAAAAVARARADVAARGLVSTIVQNFYTLVAAVRKSTSAQQGLTEAEQFLDITERQERGGEVAHSDVVKAQIQVAQRRRDAQDAELTAERSRLGLAVLVFPDFRDTFAVVDDLEQAAPLPPLDEVRARASENSPDLKAAQAALQQESFSVGSARSGYLPSLSFDYFYGINANQFATHSPPTPQNPNGFNLLGSVVQAQMNLPLWNWGATQSKVRQAELRVQQARIELSLTQRQLLANLSTFYSEAQIAQAQVDSLRASLALAAESLRLTLLRYQSGEVTVLEVVDAQTTLIQARNAYDDGLVRYRVALAALQTLTGSL